jgi:putative ABC transport system permease protein
MTFFTVVIRGLLRRPLRTGFTLAGISIGIAAVVALVGMSRGFEKGWQVGLKARGTDIVISNRSGSLTPKPFDASIRDRIAQFPNVAATCNILVEVTSVENSDLMILSAREWGSFCWGNLELVSGRMPRDAMEEAVVLGQTAADVLKKKVGDPIQIETKELKVVGIVKGGAIVEDGSVVLSLPLLQGIIGAPNQINAIDVRVTTPGTTEQQIRELTQQIEQQIPEVRAVTVSEHLSHSEGFQLVKAMSWGTSLLAILVGVLGVMNTMLMTVFERTHEISVLLALGWTRGRIIRMILYEAAMLGLLGGAVGVALGVIGVQILATTPAIRGLLKPDLSAALLTMSVVIAVAVGVVSGLYPAWRSSRLAPSRALQAG